VATQILYLPDVADRLRRTTKAVEWLVYTGQLESGKLAGRRVVTEDALERFIEAAFTETKASA
jgi:hypothetical protein